MSRAILLLLIGLSLNGCDRDVVQREALLRTRRDAIERPQLWSVQAVGQGGVPVRVCTNEVMRAGFIRPTPSVGGQACELEGDAVRTAHGWSLRCRVGTDTYAVSSGAIGNRTRVFETRVSITPLQGRNPGFQQTLRYARLGPCPAGWEIGQATDQHGVRAAALAAPDDAASP
jgi:hypothetical protein